MDDIQNIIYVIVFIIWFLYRIFGPKKKGKEAPKPPINQGGGSKSGSPSEPAPAPVTFEDILRELTGTPPATPAEPPTSPVEEEYEEDYHYQGEYEEETHEEEYVPSPAKEPTVTPVDNQGIIRIGRFKEFKKKTSHGSKVGRDVLKLLRQKSGLKQAIILKEILDRPYK